MAAADFDDRALSGLRAQLEGRRRLLEGGARPVGWKIGLNVPAVQERLGIAHPVIGFLTDAALLDPGVPHSLAGATRPAAEAEIAIELRRDVPGGAAVDAALAAIESLGPAIELVDVDRPIDDVEAILAGNVFQRGVLFGDSRQDIALSEVEARVALNGEEQHTTPAAVDLAGTIALVADLLEAAGERLRAGERIIAGALGAPIPVSAGDVVECDFGALGRLALTLEG